MKAADATPDLRRREVRPAPNPPSPSLWRDRDYLGLWTGDAISSLGTSMSSIAYPLLVLFSTGSVARAGVITAATMIGALCTTLWGGALADRVSRKAHPLSTPVPGSDRRSQPTARPCEIRGIHRPPLQTIRGVAVALGRTVTRHGAAAGIDDDGRVQRRQQGLLLLAGVNNLELHRYTGGPVFMHASSTITRTRPHPHTTCVKTTSTQCRSGPGKQRL